MRLSAYFLPLLKENPSEAQIVSHRLMLRAGMIRQSSAGIYSWLPLGLRVLQKVEQIVREEQDRSGALEILMPTIQPADLWRESGRYDDYGKEMLRISDRHEREMLYGPTNEEQITEIFRDAIKSYRDLPKNLYHIQWKFRDEVRPRFGVMRGREFLMKDAYSFDLDAAGRQALLQQDVRRLSADLRADGSEGDSDACRNQPGVVDGRAVRRKAAGPRARYDPDPPGRLGLGSLLSAYAMDSAGYPRPAPRDLPDHCAHGRIRPRRHQRLHAPAHPARAVGYVAGADVGAG